jgi:hypothetical protein
MQRFKMGTINDELYGIVQVALESVWWMIRKVKKTSPELFTLQGKKNHDRRTGGQEDRRTGSGLQ